MTPEEIVRGMPEAQKRAARELPDQFEFWPIEIARVTVKRLIEKGLLIRMAPASGFGMARHRWTEDGIAVRTYLESKEGER